ncbi:MAG: Ig-like domain-containing protein [Clostridia bacterium]|nr:Ig-like domain-containing protein [Clostridia bacterium]
MVTFFRKPMNLAILFLSILLTGFFIQDGLALESSAPLLISFSPSDGATINTSNTRVSFSVYDADLIKTSDYYIKVNGNNITANLHFPVGHSEYADPWSDSYTWVVDDYSQANIYGDVNGLKDGPQTVEVRATDRLGNAMVKTWTFNTAVKPFFSNVIPTNGSVLKNNLPNTSVKITDNDQIDPPSIVLTIDNPLPVQHTYDPASGVLSFTPTAPLSDGLHTAIVLASDKAGNRETFSWSFTVQNSGPAIIFPDKGKTFSTHKPVINVTLKSNIKLSDAGHIMKINGQPATPTFSYKGHWEYTDPWSDTNPKTEAS